MKNNSKKTMKRTMSAIMAGCMALSSGAALAADLSQTDIPPTHWAADVLSDFIDRGYLTGYGNGIYKPNNTIHRDEFVRLTNQVMQYTETSDAIRNYTDVREDAWNYTDLSIGLAAGYLHGMTETTMCPAENMTRAQAFTVIAQILGLTDGTRDDLTGFADAAQVPDWAVPYVGALVREGIVAGRSGNKLDATETLTRAEAVQLLSQCLDSQSESGYILMNIPYADFYKADVNNDAPVDAFTSATLSKTRGSLAAGSYHVNPDGSDITGITFPVKLGEGVTLADLAEYKLVTDADSVDITVTNRGQTTTTTYAGQDALFENPSYAYYVLNEEPAYYKELTLNEDGSLSFGAVQGEVQTVSDVTADLYTESSYGDYELMLDGFDEVDANTDKVYGVVVSTDENDYGLRHIENIWRVTDLAWCTGFTDAVHNCPTSSEHYASMMGQTIQKVTYYTSKGIFEIPLDDIYVPVKFENALAVENADVDSHTAAVTMSGFPEDFEAKYSVTDASGNALEGANCDGETVTWTGTPAIGTYTLTVSDESGKYAPVSASFQLTTEAVVATYDADRVALVKAEDASDEAFAAYLSSITSVSVNGTSYRASGHGSVTIINEDGTINLDATSGGTAIFEAGRAYEIEVTATGYSNNVTFELAIPVYVTMNIPYADFYAADVRNDAPVDAFTSATLAKTRIGSLVGGSYHVDPEGSDITGVAFPVKLGEGVTLDDLAQYKQVTDEDSVTITVTNRGQTTTTTYEGVEALFENESYAYYVMSEKPAYYKEVTKNADGSLSFGEVQGEVQTVSGVTTELTLESHWGDYALAVDGFDNIDASTDKVYGVVVSTDENDYGLRQLENIWRGTELAWCTGFTPDVKGCPTSSAHYEAMMGQTIKKITYYTSKGIFELPLEDAVYVPVMFENTLTVEDAAADSHTTAVTMEGFPEDYAVQYTVTNSKGEALEGASCDGETITWTGTPISGAYTLTVTDENGKYAPVSASFQLTTEATVAVYDANSLALVKADGVSDEEFENYLANITSVSVDGTAYAATGHGSVKIINSDGTINLDAGMFEAGETYTIQVTSAGYETDLVFEMTVPDGSVTFTGTATTEPDEYNDFDAYDILIDVVVKDDVIQSISLNSGCTIDTDNETYFTRALNGRGSNPGIAAQLTGKSTSEIDSVEYDVVSTATCSSHAIVKAVKDALK